MTQKEREEAQSKYYLVYFDKKDVVPKNLEVLRAPASFGNRGIVALVLEGKAGELRRMFPKAISIIGPFDEAAKAKDYCAKEDVREEKFVQFCTARKLDPDAALSKVASEIFTAVPIWMLGLSTQCRRSCQKLGIENLYDLLCYARDDLLRSNFGAKNLAEVENRLGEIRELLNLR